MIYSIAAARRSGIPQVLAYLKVHGVHYKAFTASSTSTIIIEGEKEDMTMMMTLYLVALVAIAWFVLHKAMGPAKGGGCCGSTHACEHPKDTHKS